MSQLRVALVQFKPRKGDYAGNLARVGGVFAELDALEPRPAVAAFSETALTGYFLEGGVRDVALSAADFARDLQERYVANVASGRTLDVVMGFYEVARNTFYNSAMYLTLGGSDGPLVRHVHRKVFLPTYGLFDEERFVDHGLDVRAFDTSWGRAAVLVCEDAWHSLTTTAAALDGAQVIFVPSASPGRGTWPQPERSPGPASLHRWERLARDTAEEHGVFVALIQLIGNEGGKAFPGGSLMAGPRGDVRATAPLWDEAIVTIPIDLDDITRARADSPLLADLQTMLPHLTRVLVRVGNAASGNDASRDADDGGVDRDGGADGAAGVAGAAPAAETPARNTQRAAIRPSGSEQRDPIPVVHAEPPTAGPPPLELDPALTAEWLVSFLREEFARRNFDTAVIGISGGVDSAVAAYLAVRALGPEHVVGIRMPYRTSSPESLQHAQLVIDALGIRERTVDISAAVDGYLASEPDADAARRGNVMARMRMITLFDLSAKYHALPIGTGNKTERLFGYFTWHADDSPPINPLGDLLKTQVWQLARYLGVPDVIIDKPASADLIQGQTDEGDFGISYARADDILNWLLSGYQPADLVQRGYAAADVERVRKRLAGTHWKRRLPTVAMLSPTAIGESYLRPVDY